MSQAGIITIRLEAFFVYGIWDTNRLRFKIACYFFISIYNQLLRIEEELGNRAVYGYKKIARNFKA